MKAIILAFLLQLEAIGAADPALFEMRVLAAVHGPVYAALVEGRTDAALPERFGLTSPAAEKELRTALETFIGQTRASSEYAGTTTMDTRLDLLFNDAIITPDGHAFDDYFAFAGN